MIAVPADAADEVRRRHANEGLKVEPTRNPSAHSAAAGLVPLLIYGGGCSCGMYRPQPKGSDRVEHRRRETRYRRMGWSRAKIERALSQATEASRAAGRGLHPLIVEMLREIVAAHDRVDIWVHDFRGRVETEAYTVRRRVPCPVGDIDEAARDLDTDVVLSIARAGGGARGGDGRR